MCGKYVKFYFIAVHTEKLNANDGEIVCMFNFEGKCA